MVRLAIVIPFSGEAEMLETTLASVMQFRDSDTDVVVVCGTPYSDPYQLEEDGVRFISSRQQTYRGMVALGVASTRAEWVHILSPGLQATQDWCDQPLSILSDDRSIASIAPLVLEDDGSGSYRVDSAGLSATGYALRSKRSSMAPFAEGTIAAAGAHQDLVGPEFRAGFFRRNLIAPLLSAENEIGDSHFDIDLALLLRYCGYHTEMATESILVNEGSETPQHSPYNVSHNATRIRLRYADELAVAGRGSWLDWLKGSLSSLPLSLLSWTMGGMAGQSERSLLLEQKENAARNMLKLDDEDEHVLAYPTPSVTPARRAA